MVGNTTNNLQVVAVDLAKWLAGFIEITNGRLPTVDEWNKIVEKVGAVTFTKLPIAPVEKAVAEPATPPYGYEDVNRILKEWQEKEAAEKIAPNKITHPYSPWPYPTTGQPDPYWLRNITVD